MENNLEDLISTAIIEDNIKEVKELIKSKLDKINETINKEVENKTEELNEKIKKLETQIKALPANVNVGTLENPDYKVVHKDFNKILNVLQSAKRIEKNIMLVGPCGSGKTSLCKQIAEALKLNYYPMSVGLQTTKSDLMGFINAKGDYVTSPVREAFEKGGILLLDEFDSAHAGVVTILNSVLANDIVGFPDKTVNKNKDFICLVACNTYGNGGSFEYIGRNKLDAATLDRFITFDVGYDGKMEKNLVKNNFWLDCINKMRKNIEKFKLKVIISPRASMHGADLLDTGMFNIFEVLDMCIFKGLNEDVKIKLTDGIDFENKSCISNTDDCSDMLNNAIHIELDFMNNLFEVEGIETDFCLKRLIDWELNADLSLNGAEKNNTKSSYCLGSSFYLVNTRKTFMDIAFPPSAVIFLKIMSEHLLSVKKIKTPYKIPQPIVFNIRTKDDEFSSVVIEG